jgi:hypothetical protein
MGGNTHCDLCCLQSAKVTAHNVASADGVSDRTVFLIKFSAEVRVCLPHKRLSAA